MGDYDSQVGYDPFRAFNDLEAHKNTLTFEPHVNRIHKINRFKSRDHGTFMIADNRLRLYPYYRNILMNTYTMNEDYRWSLGTKNKMEQFKKPDVRSVKEGFEHFNRE